MNLKTQEVRRSLTTTILMSTGVLVLSAATCLAQDLGDLARKERERQKNIPHPAQHVYTNEDLQKPEILAPEDRARIEAENPTPQSNSDSRAVNAGNPETIPLGDVARHYRLLNKLHEIEKADRTDVLPVRKAVRARPNFTPPHVIVIPPTPEQKPHPARRTAERGLSEAVIETKIRVGEGDSLWKLARKHLGSGAEWTRLAAANPQLRDPNRLRPGEWIQLPQEKTNPSSAQVRVQSGDTLWKLAQANFGNGLAWSCIAEANPELPDANRIRTGQLLTLPARCDSAKISAGLR